MALDGTVISALAKECDKKRGAMSSPLLRNWTKATWDEVPQEHPKPAKLSPMDFLSAVEGKIM